MVMPKIHTELLLLVMHVVVWLVVSKSMLKAEVVCLFEICIHTPDCLVSSRTHELNT
jgi:hypothetical protein